MSDGIRDADDNYPIYGCGGCAGTMGRAGCPYHGPQAGVAMIWPPISAPACQRCAAKGARIAELEAEQKKLQATLSQWMEAGAKAGYTFLVGVDGFHVIHDPSTAAAIASARADEAEAERERIAENFRQAEESRQTNAALYERALSERERLARELAEAREQYLDLAGHIATCGVELDDARLKYVTLQIDRSVWMVCCAEVAHDAVSSALDAARNGGPDAQ